jgi:hypothetical protein
VGNLVHTHTILKSLIPATRLVEELAETVILSASEGSLVSPAMAR